MFRNFLSNSQINTFGFSTIFVISFNKLSLVFIKIFLLFDNFCNSEFMKSFLFSWLIITPLVLKNFKYWVISYNNRSYPSKDQMHDILKSFSNKVSILEKDHNYQITGKIEKKMNKELLFIVET